MERFFDLLGRRVPVVCTSLGCLFAAGWFALGASVAFQRGDVGYGVFFAAAGVLMPGCGILAVWCVHRMAERLRAA